MWHIIIQWEMYHWEFLTVSETAARIESHFKTLIEVLKWLEKHFTAILENDGIEVTITQKFDNLWPVDQFSKMTTQDLCCMSLAINEWHLS